MKQLWLSLAALMAFAAAAAMAAVIDQPALHPEQSARYLRCPWNRPGCYSSISGMIPMVSEPTLRPIFPDWQLQPHLEEEMGPHPTEEARLSILRYLKMASMEMSRAKRHTRKARPARRRGKQREGARRVCRGCYSGLTIVAPPAQDGKNMSLMWSHSESSEDSSAGY